MVGGSEGNLLNKNIRAIGSNTDMMATKLNQSESVIGSGRRTTEEHKGGAGPIMMSGVLDDATAKSRMTTSTNANGG